MTQNNAVDPIADIGHQTESAAARRERLIRFISSQPLPIMPLSVSIGEDGEIRRKDGTDPLRFTFRWREIAYTGTLRAAPEGVFLSLIADLGVGTGAIGLSVLAEVPGCRCIGVDRSSEAVKTARANAEALGLSDRYEVREGDWFDGIESVFDLILSNPPYIPSADIEGLSLDVRISDPALALDGGGDGLDAYRAIARTSKDRLASGRAVMLEIGQGQAEDVTALFEAQGYRFAGKHADLGGIDRVLVLRKP